MKSARVLSSLAVLFSLAITAGPASAFQPLTQNDNGSIRFFGGESIRVTRGPSDFFSIFRPKEKKKPRRSVRRSTPIKTSPRPKMRDSAFAATSLGALGEIEDTVARPMLDAGIGRLTGYQAAEATRVATELRLDAAREILRELDAQATQARGSADILRDFEALNLDAPDYDASFLALKDELDALGVLDARRDELVREIDQLEAQTNVGRERADEALLIAANGRDLAPDTRRDLNHLLGLPTAQAR